MRQFLLMLGEHSHISNVYNIEGGWRRSREFAEFLIMLN